ncbi:MAG: glycosyltransferase family 4 protein [Xanthobacteraceae bacterium]
MGELRRPVASMLAPAMGAAAPMTQDAVGARVQSGAAPASLKILHILRAPLGGLFRHVLDVAQGQAARGHRVGLVVDSITGGARANELLAQLAPKMALNIARVPIARQLGFGDIGALQFVAQRVAAVEPDVVHGHGAKGAALARLAPRGETTIRVYTPHGGSLVYAPGTAAGGFYRVLERLLNARTDLFLFESEYIAQMFRDKIGAPHGLVRVVRNGVGEADLAPIVPRPDATDLVCVGELRSVKAIDVLIEALAMLRHCGRRFTATIAGDGPQRDELVALAQRFGVDDQIRFVGFRPARDAFSMGKLLVVCSRAESLPYIVLEAAAATMPMVSTRVGGIGEIFGPEAGRLIPADDVTALAHAILGALNDPAQLHVLALALNARVREEFTIDKMVDAGLAAYRETLAQRQIARLN